MSNIRPLSMELQQKAVEELNEDVSRIPQDIQAIKDWLNLQKHIKARTEDQWIVTFLRGCKFSLERTKEKIESYYSMRTLLPEFSKNRDPFLPEIQELLKRGQFLPVLNLKNPTAPRFAIHNANFDANITKKEDVVKLQTMISDIILNENDRFLICGIQFIVDFKNIKMAQIYPPSLIAKTLTYLGQAMPCRIKAFYLLNMPTVVENIQRKAMGFLSDKLQKRMHVYSSNHLEELYKEIDKEDLPKEYGGNGPSIEELKDFWKEKVESYAEWFKEDEQYCSDEKLRPGKPRTVQECFGVEGVDGSFRKLNVD